MLLVAITTASSRLVIEHNYWGVYFVQSKEIKAMSKVLYNICREACCSDENVKEARLKEVKQWLEENKQDLKVLDEAAYFKDENGATPLHYLVRANPPSDLVQQILQVVPDTAKAQSVCGWLPLHVALFIKTSPDLVKLLLKAYPESTTVQNRQGHLPLHIACTMGVSIELMDLLLLAYPESADIQDKMDYVPSAYLRNQITPTKHYEHLFLLHNAIIGGYSIHLVKFFLKEFPESCIKQDEDGMIPLHHACLCNAPHFFEYVRVLLDANSEESLTIQDKLGRTPLQLLKRILSTPDEAKRLPLHRLAASSASVSEKSLQVLVDAYPESITSVDKDGMLPFYYACLNPVSSLGVIFLFLMSFPEAVLPCEAHLKKKLEKDNTCKRRRLEK